MSSETPPSCTRLDGFSATICVACYGPHTDLAERFLSNLYCHTNPALFTLRAGLNEVAPSTLALFREHAARYGNIDLFIEPKNVFKSPLMRRMFYEKPILTPWVLWFDDDSHPTRPDWLQRLALRTEAAPGVIQWGQTHALWRTDEAIHDFISSASWFRGLPLRRGVNLDGVDAFEFRFATGGFWAIRTEVIHQLNWPDPRLVQANDDFLLGEALRQNGHEIGLFEYGVAINKAARRNAGAPEVERLPGVPLDGA